MDKKLVYSVEEAGALLGISRNTAYAAARSGEIPTVRIAKRVLVPRAAFHRMLENAGQEPRRDGSEAAA